LQIKWKWPSILKRKYYVSFLLRYVLEKGKVLFLVTKLYNCAALYLMLAGRDPARHSDIRMMALFFSAGMLGHGILIHRLKEMENTGMSFYRSLPVSVSRRFVQYCLFYFCLFLPEIITIAARTPACLQYEDAGFFIFFGFGILLLLNSLQLYNYSSLKNYLVNVTQLFFAVIIAMVSRQLYALSIIFFALAVLLFFYRYYRFEPQQNPDLL
jgi:predicted permease